MYATVPGFANSIKSSNAATDAYTGGGLVPSSGTPQLAHPSSGSGRGYVRHRPVASRVLNLPRATGANYGLGCAGSGNCASCSGCAQGMGDLNSIVSDAAGIFGSLGWLGWAGAGFLGWYLFSGRASNIGRRRRAISEAKAEYRAKVDDIQTKYPYFRKGASGVKRIMLSVLDIVRFALLAGYIFVVAGWFVSAVSAQDREDSWAVRELSRRVGNVETQLDQTRGGVEHRVTSLEVEVNNLQADVANLTKMLWYVLGGTGLLTGEAGLRIVRARKRTEGAA